MTLCELLITFAGIFEPSSQLRCHHGFAAFSISFLDCSIGVGDDVAHFRWRRNQKLMRPKLESPGCWPNPILIDDKTIPNDAHFPITAQSLPYFLPSLPEKSRTFSESVGEGKRKRKAKKKLRRRGIFVEEKLSAKTYDFHPPKRKRIILFYAVPYEMIFPFFLVREIPTPHSSPWLALVR